jgi:hypothetical protein
MVLLLKRNRPNALRGPPEGPEGPHDPQRRALTALEREALRSKLAEDNVQRRNDDEGDRDGVRAGGGERFRQAAQEQFYQMGERRLSDRSEGSSRATCAATSHLTNDTAISRVAPPRPADPSSELFWARGSRPQQDRDIIEMDAACAYPADSEEVAHSSAERTWPSMSPNSEIARQNVDAP